jgi:hypothetical protein
MRKDIKDRWIAALQSGKYRQITGFLATDDGGRCAVGVLADLAAEAGVVVRRARPLGDGTKYRWAYDGLMYSLPTAALKWAGITEAETNAVMDMNDVEVPFSTIAEWIKENL